MDASTVNQKPPASGNIQPYYNYGKDSKDKEKELITLLDLMFNSLRAQRSSWETIWLDIMDYIMPDRGDFYWYPNVPKLNRFDNIVDATATRALNDAAAGFQAGLTSAARPWFKLTLLNTDKLKSQKVKEWLYTVEQLIYKVFNTSNFYPQTHITYQDDLSFGTSCMLVDDDPKDVINCKVFTTGEYWLQQNENNEVDTMFRLFYMTARNMIRMFGDKVPQEIRTIAEKNPYQWFRVMHAVMPNENYNPTLWDNRYKKFKSIYYTYEGTRTILRESGYETNPIIATRFFRISQNVYGICPAMMAIGSVKMLQEMKIGRLNAVHQQLDPAMLFPDTLIAKPPSTIAGSANFVSLQEAEQIKKVFDFNFDIQGATLSIEDERNLIRSILYSDVISFFLNNPRSDRTAQEVSAIDQEKLLLFGPVIENQIHEKLEKIIERTFDALDRGGKLPPVPEELAEESIEIEFISLFAQAQKYIGVRSIEGALGIIGAFAQIDKQAIDVVNVDNGIELACDMMGTPPPMLNSRERIKEIRQQRSAMEQQQMAAQMAQQQAQTAATTATASKDMAAANMVGGGESSV